MTIHLNRPLNCDISQHPAHHVKDLIAVGMFDEKDHLHQDAQKGKVEFDAPGGADQLELLENGRERLLMLTSHTSADLKQAISVAALRDLQLLSHASKS